MQHSLKKRLRHIEQEYGTSDGPRRYDVLCLHLAAEIKRAEERGDHETARRLIREYDRRSLECGRRGVGLTDEEIHNALVEWQAKHGGADHGEA